MNTVILEVRNFWCCRASSPTPRATFRRDPMCAIRGDSVHAPWTEQGCELLVKLCQFQTGDHERVIVDTLACGWEATEQPGLSVIRLHEYGDETVALFRLAAGTKALSMNYPSGAEMFLLDGAFENETTNFPAGTWLRLPVGTHQILSSERGCRFYTRQGHYSSDHSLD